MGIILYWSSSYLVCAVRDNGKKSTWSPLLSGPLYWMCVCVARIKFALRDSKLFFSPSRLCLLKRRACVCISVCERGQRERNKGRENWTFYAHFHSYKRARKKAEAKRRGRLVSKLVSPTGGLGNKWIMSAFLPDQKEALAAAFFTFGDQSERQAEKSFQTNAHKIT